MIDISAVLKRDQFTLEADLHLERKVTGLFGPSGSGKSTLLNIVAGLVRPDKGQVSIDGLPLFDHARRINMPIHRRQIGLVFQDSRLFPHQTVRGNLEYGLQLLKKPARVFGLGQITELLELERLLNQQPHQLSGGEKQRVALGRALLSSPRLLLLDEPLASLDFRLKGQILPFLKRVADEINIPMLYISHAINEVLYLTSNIAFMEHGKILAHGEFHEILHSPAMLELSYSLGLENVLNARVMVRDDAVGCTVVEYFGQQFVIPLIDMAADQSVMISIRASNIALSVSPVTGTTIQNQIQGTVVDLRVVDSRVLVSVDIGSVIFAEVSMAALRELNIEPGSRVFCLIKTQSIVAL